MGIPFLYNIQKTLLLIITPSNLYILAIVGNIPTEPIYILTLTVSKGWEEAIITPPENAPHIKSPKKVTQLSILNKIN